MSLNSVESIANGPINNVEQILAYTRLINSEKWFVFWFHETDIFGITDGYKLYERRIQVNERKTFIGNVAETILHAKWPKIFKDRAFHVDLNDDVAEVTYQSRTVHLQRIENINCMDRVIAMLTHYMEKHRLSEKEKAKNDQVQEPKDVADPTDSPRPPPLKTRRKRVAPGCVFSDV